MREKDDESLRKAPAHFNLSHTFEQPSRLAPSSSQ